MTATAHAIAGLRHARTALRIGRVLVSHGLFQHVRLGYAIWHVLAVAGRPLHVDDIVKALERGRVLTIADDVERAVKSSLRWHSQDGGKIRKLGNDFYAIR